MYMYIAIFRKKENKKKVMESFDTNHNNVSVIRELGRFPEEQIIKKLKATISNFQGTWRIYRSVNERDVNKAFKDLQIAMIRGECDASKVDSKWKSILMKPKNKLGRGKWLIDVDDPEQIVPVTDFIKDKLKEHKKVKYNESDIEVYHTPNGFGIITPKFDTREFKFNECEIKKDALKFIEKIEVS